MVMYSVSDKTCNFIVYFLCISDLFSDVHVFFYFMVLFSIDTSV